MTFKDYFSKTGTSRYVNGPRHRKDTFTDTDRYYRRQRQNLVADMYKKDNSKNQKIEQLKGSTGLQVCNPQDLSYIRDVFKITDFSTPKALGKTGITVSRCPKTGNIILTK